MGINVVDETLNEIRLEVLGFELVLRTCGGNDFTFVCPRVNNNDQNELKPT